MNSLYPKTSIALEFSGLMHDIRYHRELVNVFYPLEVYYQKLITEFNLNEEAVKIAVSRTDRNMRKSFVTLTLFSLETILKHIAKYHEISFQNNNTISLYVSVMKYFDIYSKNNENLVKILHYTRNTLHNGDRVDKEAHLSYNEKTFDFIPNPDLTQKDRKQLDSTKWDYLTYLFQQLLEVFQQIIISPKYTLKSN